MEVGSGDPGKLQALFGISHRQHFEVHPVEQEGEVHQEGIAIGEDNRLRLLFLHAILPRHVSFLPHGLFQCTTFALNRDRNG
jgi:hypothetical protein